MASAHEEAKWFTDSDDQDEIGPPDCPARLADSIDFTWESEC